jgi:hypothetical protein
MRKLVFVLAACVCAVAFATDKEKGVIIEDRPLAWDDFKGKAAHNGFVAYTGTYIELERFMIYSDGRIPKFNVVCYFQPKGSWVKEDVVDNYPDSTSNYLLKHEQTHYDISRIATAEMNEVLNSFNYDKKRFAMQADSIFRALHRKCREINERYDRETNHSRIREEQIKWNKLIAESLQKGKLPDL